MKQIWKFMLTMAEQEVLMPKDAEVAYYDFQHAIPCIWAIVDVDAPKEPRRFAIFGTGHELPEHACYIGTKQQGPFVWHLFELL